MILDKVLLLKGLGGLSACAGLGCGATYLINPDLFRSNDQTLVDLISKVGLISCTNVNKECTIKTEGISVKQGESNKEKSKTKQTGSSGKIKVYSDSNYENKFKFVIEDGDITLTGGSGSTTISKLEQFETYEIKKEDSGNDWYLTRKSDALEEKFKALGLPSGDTNCKLPSSDSDTKTCSLDANKLKAINFEGKNETGATIDNNETDTITLKITKTTDTTTYPNGGYKFAFETNKDITISSSSAKYIKKNTNTEFKIKKEGNSLSLEKVWTVDALAKKAGLTGCDTSTKECTLPTETNLKLYNGANDKVENGKVEGSKKIKYEENAADHNQGFKFFTESEITLGGDNSSKKIEQKGDSNTTYEIKEIDNKWYLSKVSPSTSA